MPIELAKRAKQIVTDEISTEVRSGEHWVNNPNAPGQLKCDIFMPEGVGTTTTAKPTYWVWSNGDHFVGKLQNGCRCTWGGHSFADGGYSLLHFDPVRGIHPTKRFFHNATTYVVTYSIYADNAWVDRNDTLDTIEDYHFEYLVYNCSGRFQGQTKTVDGIQVPHGVGFYQYQVFEVNQLIGERIYIGVWKNGKPNGFGRRITTSAEPEILEGYWNDFVLDGFAYHVSGGGQMRKQHYLHLKFDTDTNRYHAEHHHGLVQSLTYLDEGEMTKEKLHGKGVRVFFDARRPQAGIWQNGEFIEPFEIRLFSKSRAKTIRALTNLQVRVERDESRQSYHMDEPGFRSKVYSVRTSANIKLPYRGFLGFLVNGVPQGWGACIWDVDRCDVGYYEGAWSPTQRIEVLSGTMLLHNGTSKTQEPWLYKSYQYSGEYKGLFSPKPEGLGYRTNASPDQKSFSYIGQFSDGEYKGMAIYSSFSSGISAPADSGIYQGEVEAVADPVLYKKHGYGMFFFNENHWDLGHWRDNKFSGYGVRTRSEVDGGSISYLHEGYFEEGKAHGQGLRIFRSGEREMGTWRNEQLDGAGLIQWPSGQEYCGGFRQDKYHGPGIMFYSNGNSYIGAWVNDLRHTGYDERAMYRENRFVYIAHFINNLMEGRAVCLEFSQDPANCNVFTMNYDQGIGTQLRRAAMNDGNLLQLDLGVSLFKRWRESANALANAIVALEHDELRNIETIQNLLIQLKQYHRSHASSATTVFSVGSCLTHALLHLSHVLAHSPLLAVGGVVVATVVSGVAAFASWPGVLVTLTTISVLEAIHAIQEYQHSGEITAHNEKIDWQIVFTLEAYEHDLDLTEDLCFLQQTEYATNDLKRIEIPVTATSNHIQILVRQKLDSMAILQPSRDIHAAMVP